MKISDRDLVLGNWFIGFDDKPFEWSLESFHLLDIYRLELNEIIKSPIPITEEWLLKFGFEEIKPLPDDEINKWSSYSKKGIVIDLPYFEFNSEDISIEIKSVHQLMNLFHSLTQTELTITK